METPTIASSPADDRTPMRSSGQRDAGTGDPTRDVSTNEVADRRRRRGSVPSDVADYLRRQIVSGALEPGERIDQHRIASELDVSRSPIREAVVLLSQEGLIDLVPCRGAYVADLQPVDVIEHYRLLGTVAGDTAADAAERLDDEARQRLRDLDRRCRSVPQSDIPTLKRLNDEFVSLVNDAAPRRTRWLLELMTQSVPIDVDALGSAWAGLVAEHRSELLRAIEDRDPNSARDAAQRYARAAGASVAAMLHSGRDGRRPAAGSGEPSEHPVATANRETIGE